MNQVAVMGNLTRDLKTTDVKGKKKISGTVAVNYTRTDANFIPFEAWEKTADTLERFCSRKGDRVCLSGYLQSQSWTSKDDSGKEQNNSRLILVATHVTLAGKQQNEVEEYEVGQAVDIGDALNKYAGLKL